MRLPTLRPEIKNKNLRHLVECFNSGKRGASLRGSSRSGKTWDSIDFLILICSLEQKATINIIKESYNSFKTTLYDDFNRRLPDYGLRSPFADKKEVSQFRIFGNKINLLGADDPSKFHGASCDYFWCNEVLDVSKAVFDQSEQRCRKFWWADYNPKVSDHWFYTQENRPDVGFLKTTFLDNPRISIPEKNKILSYEPTEVNKERGTADDYMWNVYGLGLASTPEGLVFQNVTWIDKFPDDCEKVYYGLDFGYTNDPSALVKIGILRNDLFLESLFYSPTESPEELVPILEKHCGKAAVWADPSGRGMIAVLRRKGFNIMAAKSFPGSIDAGISVMKGKSIHLVDGPSFRKEQANYKYRTVDGKPTNDPVDGFNHNWDAARGAILANIS